MEQENKESLVELEAKVQTIFFQDTKGNLERYYNVANERLNLKQAEQLLIDEGINVALILRTMIEKVTIQLTRKEVQERIIMSENFHARKN